MTTQLTAGSKVYVGTTTVMTTGTLYAADTWTQIKGVSDMGEFGDTATEVKFTTIEDRRVRKYAGSLDGGDVSIVVALDPADAGQVILRSIAGVNAGHNVKITANDTPSGGGTPTTWYFQGIVMGQPAKMGSADNVITQTFKIAVDSDTIMVPAAS